MLVYKIVRRFFHTDDVGTTHSFFFLLDSGRCKYHFTCTTIKVAMVAFFQKDFFFYLWDLNLVKECRHPPRVVFMASAAFTHMAGAPNCFDDCVARNAQLSSKKTAGPESERSGVEWNI
jgi:hypothetical protein